MLRLALLLALAPLTLWAQNPSAPTPAVVPASKIENDSYDWDHTQNVLWRPSSFKRPVFMPLNATF